MKMLFFYCTLADRTGCVQMCCCLCINCFYHHCLFSVSCFRPVLTTQQRVKKKIMDVITYFKYRKIAGQYCTPLQSFLYTVLKTCLASIRHGPNFYVRDQDPGSTNMRSILPPNLTRTSTTIIACDKAPSMTQLMKGTKIDLCTCIRVFKGGHFKHFFSRKSRHRL